MMMDNKTKSINVFLCYAREDETLCNQLKMHLSSLERQGFIDVWSDHDIDIGAEWIYDIDKHLKEADIILLLISPDFMASEYHSPHVRRAIQRLVGYDPQRVSEDTDCDLIIPILLRPTYREDTLLAQLDVLPRNHIPVTEFEDQDEAFCDIAKELRHMIENSLTNMWQDEANQLYREGRYNEALSLYEKILQLKNSLAASVCKGNALAALRRYGEALHAYEQAEQRMNSNRSSFRKKASLVNRPADDRKFYEEAVQIYEQMFQKNLYYSSHSSWPGMTLEDISQKTIPQSVGGVIIDHLNKAIKHNPLNPFLYHLKGNVFFRLEQYREALGAYEQAIQLQEGFELSRRYLSEAIENISQQEYKKFNGLARRDLERANQIRDDRGDADN